MDYKKLRLFRLSARLTQLLVSDKLNMSQNSYSLAESGKSSIPIDKCVLLAEILNVKPQELLTDSELELFHILCGSPKETFDQSKLDEYEEKIKYLAKMLEIKDTQIEALKIQMTQLVNDAKKHNDLNKF